MIYLIFPMYTIHCHPLPNYTQGKLQKICILLTLYLWSKFKQGLEGDAKYWIHYFLLLFFKNTIYKELSLSGIRKRKWMILFTYNHTWMYWMYCSRRILRCLPFGWFICSDLVLLGWEASGTWDSLKGPSLSESARTCFSSELLSL